MTRARSIQVLIWTGVVMVAMLAAVAGLSAVGQAAPSAEEPAAQTSAKPAAEAPAETPVPEKDAATEEKEFRGRLPAYYSGVVDEDQREKIYAIQREYAPKIDALKAQWAALMADRDKQVAAVLTPEQLKQVEKLKAEAKAKRDKAKSSAR